MEDWRERIKSMLFNLVEVYELPEGSLFLSENKPQKDSNSTISYSVCIWEPDFPPRKDEKPSMNKIVTTISPSTVKSRPDDLDLSMQEIQERDLRDFLPDDAEVLSQTKTDKTSGTVKVRFKVQSLTLSEYVRKNTEYCIKNYVSKADKFGCCSHYNQCSDAGKCVHENKLFSKACMYRVNLEQGRIFYGKEKNRFCRW